MFFPFSIPFSIIMGAQIWLLLVAALVVPCTQPAEASKVRRSAPTMTVSRLARRDRRFGGPAPRATRAVFERSGCWGARRASPLVEAIQARAPPGQGGRMSCSAGIGRAGPEVHPGDPFPRPRSTALAPVPPAVPPALHCSASRLLTTRALRHPLRHARAVAEG